MIAAFAFQSHVLRPRYREVRQTAEVRDLADTLSVRAGEDFQLEYLDAPCALQFFFNTIRREISFEEARERLTEPAPAGMAVKNLERFEHRTGLTADSLNVIARCPEKSDPFLVVLSNRPGFK